MNVRHILGWRAEFVHNNKNFINKISYDGFHMMTGQTLCLFLSAALINLHQDANKSKARTH